MSCFALEGNMKHPLLTTMLLTSVTLCAHAEVTLFGQNLKTVTRPQMQLLS